MKYIVPDKLAWQPKNSEAAIIGGGDPGDAGGEVTTGASKKNGGKRKPAYAGGLVLEPKKGFYDKYFQNLLMAIISFL